MSINLDRAQGAMDKEAADVGHGGSCLCIHLQPLQKTCECLILLLSIGVISSFAFIILTNLNGHKGGCKILERLPKGRWIK